MKIIFHLLLSDHLKNCHGTYCCTYSFNIQVAFDVHQAKKHSAKDENGHFVCHKCQKAFQSVRTLLSHVRVDHFKHLPFKCDQCDKCFDLKAKRIRHVKTVHTTEFDYQCDKCDKCYKQQNSLNEHLKNVHGTETYHCDKCEYTSKNLKLLENYHLRMHSTGQIVCDQCGKTFTNSISLSDHKNNSHRNLEEYGEFKCTFQGCDYPGCNKSYGVRGNMYAHKKRVHKVHWSKKFD